MKAIRIKKPSPGEPAWSSSHPPSSSTMELIDDAVLPQAVQSGDLLVKVKAASVVRDNLTWPELYSDPPAQLGNDFAGVVVDSLSDDFKSGDEVYGMLAAERGGTWSEYILVKSEEVCKKPKTLSWAEAAALPLSALTADQALFVHGKIDEHIQKRVLVTGAAGAVGMYLIQFSLAAKQEIVAATSSNVRNGGFLKSLGADTSIEYSDLKKQAKFDVIVDTVGGDVLKSCWEHLKDEGILITIDSASWNFVEEHREFGLLEKHPRCTPIFFIVEPSRASLQRISAIIAQGNVQVLVSSYFALEEFQKAYDYGNSRSNSKGRTVLLF